VSARQTRPANGVNMLFCADVAMIAVVIIEANTRGPLSFGYILRSRTKADLVRLLALTKIWRKKILLDEEIRHESGR